MAPKAWPGFVPDYNPRPYNPQKAKELLAEAGFAKGFETAILSNANTGQDFAAAVQGYLAAVGIKTRMDQADMGRYFGSVFGTGWKDLAIAASGINPDATDLFVHFGPEPMTYRTGNIKKTPEFLARCEEALHTYDKEKMIAKIKEAVKQGGEDAMVIPIYRSTQANVMQPYVHSQYMTIHSVHWLPYLDWMEKH
jgi:peptide/nickel transport system substrate-binding protein